MERSGSSFTPKLTIDPVFKLSMNTPRTPSLHTTFQADHGFAKRVRQHCCALVHMPYAASVMPSSAVGIAEFLAEQKLQTVHATPALACRLMRPQT